MMSQFLSLMVVLVVSVLQIADAVSCYQCNYTSSVLGKSTCSEPFNATNTVKCSAPLCTWQFTNYTYPISYTHVYRACRNYSIFVHTDRCELSSNEFNYTSFKYNDSSCCFTTGTQVYNEITYSRIACFCEKDNCNGNIPVTLTPSLVELVPATTAASIATTTAATITIVTSSRYASPNGSDGLSDGGKIGIGVGIGVGGTLVSACILIVVLCRRYEITKRSKTETSEESRLTSQENTNTPQYEQLNALSAQTTNLGPTYEQLSASTNVDATEESLSSRANYANFECTLNTNASLSPEYEGLQEREQCYLSLYSPIDHSTVRH